MASQPVALFKSVRVNPERIDVNGFWRDARIQAEVWMREVMLAGEGYPAPPVGSRYERTGLLVGSWQVVSQMLPDMLVVSLVNNATDKYGRQYMQRVQGHLQTRLHRRTGWQRMDRLARSPDFSKRLSNRLRGAVIRNRIAAVAT